MIENIGIDILENQRLNRSINPEFVDTILTKKEKEIYESKNGKKKKEFLYGRFAAKEAIIKAINDYENPHFLEIEILNKKNGAPFATFKHYKLLISISHEQHYTIAEAILVK